MILRFTKMHGLGNDFMVIDLVTQRFAVEPAWVQRVADRRTGVGFDQLLTLEPPGDPEADFRYRIWNADGSEVEQCGNGVRCVARFALLAGLTRKTTLVLESAGGLLATRVQDDGSVSVDMGTPDTDPASLPLRGSTLAADGVSHSIAVPGHGPVLLVPVSVGNPHAVIFVADVDTAPVDSLGPALQTHPAFPESVNVGFCQVLDRSSARLRVYERGVGETRACGTGACAAAVAGQLAGHLGQQVHVSLPGGALRLDWPGPGQPIRMQGPASHVFEGTLTP